LNAAAKGLGLRAAEGFGGVVLGEQGEGGEGLHGASACHEIRIR
jgi:hypothetical protein